MTVPSPGLKNRLPDWFRQELPGEAALEKARQLAAAKINTVCRKAHCPNWGECFGRSRFTFMILGDKCTRSCKFCAVEKAGAERLSLDADEPRRVAEAVKDLGGRYAVVTSVTRDDLIDGGAGVFAETLRLIRAFDKQVKIEALIPDFKGRQESLRSLLEASPDVVGHNIETVRRLYRGLRPDADYSLSLNVLAALKKINPGLLTKSAVMLGLGESAEEVLEVMRDLRKAGCDILALGQYLAPSERHYPVKEFITPQEFNGYKKEALSLGFKAVLSAPLVRSSYKAEEIYDEVTAHV